MEKHYSRRDEFLDLAEEISSTLSEINEKVDHLIHLYESQANEEFHSSDDSEDE